LWDHRRRREAVDVLAAVLPEEGSAPVFAQVTVDVPAPDEVLVRTVAAGVCHTDLSVISRRRRVPTPVVLGHEAAGVVEEVGSSVDHVRPGDHVVACLSVFCGACRWCVSGRPAFCDSDRVRRGDRLLLDGRPVGAFGQIGAFAERLLIHQNALVRISGAVPLDVAAMLGCAVVTGLGSVFHTAAVAPGQTVAVLGCGGVGLNCVQGARLAGASRIIAVDTVPARLALATRLGATDQVPAGPGAVERVVELSGGGVEHVFEAVGSADTVARAFGMLCRDGVCTVVGALPTGAEVTLPAADLVLGKTLRGCRMGSNRFRVDIPRYLEFYADGRLRLDELVSRRLPFERLPDALGPPDPTGARTVLTF
jgi:S-(hydroxymethyl)glutathione dehydrogenase/alcohol dehydrogenase